MGIELTVSVAAVVVADPPAFVNTARYWYPFWPADVVKLNVVEIAPETFEKLAPPLVLTCHCTVGAGVPVADAVKVTVDPAPTDWLRGSFVTCGATPLLVSEKFTGVRAPAEAVTG